MIWSWWINTHTLLNTSLKGSFKGHIIGHYYDTQHAINKTLIVIAKGTLLFSYIVDENVDSNNHKNDANYASCGLHCREDVFNSDLIWRRLIQIVQEQILAKLRSSQGLVVL